MCLEDEKKTEWQPVFPVAGYAGISKRDLFAAMAMQGLCTMGFEGMMCDRKYW